MFPPCSTFHDYLQRVFTRFQTANLNGDGSRHPIISQLQKVYHENTRKAALVNSYLLSPPAQSRRASSVMMMDRQQQSQHHHHHNNNNNNNSHDGSQQQPQSYEPPTHPPRSHLSRSISYPVPTQNSYSTQIHENLSSSSLPVSHHKTESTSTTATQYAGLGISLQGNDNSQPQLLPSPDSPFSSQLLNRYGGTGQPPTPSFPNLRSSSPASSVWSASDQGTSSSTLSGFIPRLHKYFPSLIRQS